MRNISTSYEILRFTEQGGFCRPAMDCVKGELLLQRLKTQTLTGKEEIFDWLRMLCRQLEQYHRCSGQRSYQYVNPYSILLTDKGEIFLLDLSAKSNGFVLRNMQKRAMQNHFGKYLFQWKACSEITADLYGFGKTVQFIFANAHLDIPLTKMEEYRINKIVQTCIREDGGKGYKNFAQVCKAIPRSTPKRHNRKRGKFFYVSVAGLFLVAGYLLIGKVFFQKSDSTLVAGQEVLQTVQEEADAVEETVEKQQKVKEEAVEESSLPVLREALGELEEYLLLHEDDESLVSEGKTLRKQMVEFLSSTKE